MKRVLLLLSCLFILSSAFAQRDTITTSPPLTANNGQSGVTFEFESNQPVDIVDLLVTFSTATSANLWMRVGGVLHPGATSPNITTANGWSQVITNAPVTGANSTTPVLMDFQGQKISIPANTRMGFFVDGAVRYQTGTSSDQTVYTDGVGTVYVSDNIAYGGGPPTPTFNPRRFLGSVIYELAVTGNCTPFTNFAIDSISGTSARINWTPGTGNTSFKLEYGPTGFTPGTGTIVTGTYPGAAQPPAILTGLSAQTTYDVYFEEYCNSGTDTVGFPVPQSFTTTKLCAPPTNLAVSNVLTNQVDLSWNYAGSAQSFDVIYGPVGFDPTTTGTSVTVTGGSPYTLTGLNASTSYDAYLVAYCGMANGYSDTIGPEFFFTNCAISTAPFTEKFDDPTWVASGGNAGNQINPCWTASPDMSQGSEPFKWIPRSTGPTSGNGPLSDFTGGNFMYCEASGSSAGDIAEFTTPLIDVSGLNTPALYFMQHRYYTTTSPPADMDIEVSNDGGTTWNNVYNITGNTQSSSSDPWELVFVNLGGYIGDTIQLKFIQTSVGCCGDAAIDSVVVDEAPLCPWPTNVSITGLTDTSFTVSWDDPTGSNWDVEWGPCGYTQGTGSFQTTSNKPFTGTTNVFPNTCYDLYIRANCTAAGNGNSIWIGPISFNTQCTGFLAPYSANFDGTTAPALDNCWTEVEQGNSSQEVGTDAFRNYSPPNSLEIHNSGSLSGIVAAASPRFDDLDSTKQISMFVYDEDGSFDGSDLIIGTMTDPLDTSTFTPYDTITEAEMDDDVWEFFVVQFDRYTGTDKYIAFVHGMNSTFDNIHIDDFSYENIPLCNPPLITTLSVAPGATTANISWGSGSAGDETYIEWGTPGFVPGTGSYVGLDSVPGSVDSYSMTGLSPQSNYDVYIADSCAGSSISPWVGPINFYTACLAQAMPYYESLDNWPVACWDSTQGSADWVKYTGTGGDNYAEADFWSNSTGIYNLTSPPITISQDAQLRFYWSHLYSTSYPQDELLVRATVVGSGVWDTILSLKGPNDFNDNTAGNTAPGSFVEEEVLLNPQLFTGNDIIIEFVGVSDFGPNAYLNDIYVENAPTCPDPGGLTTTNTGPTSADLTWFGPSAATGYEVWYGPQGFFQGTQTTGGTKVVSSGTGTTYNLTGLTSNTCYEFLVRSICVAGDTSAWVGPVVFCTPCTAISAPYFEDFTNNNVGHFDGEDNCWTFSSNNPGTTGSGGYSWEVRNSPQTTSSGTGPDRDNTIFPLQGGTFITADVSGSSTAIPDSTMLVSPVVDISGLTTPELEYHIHRYGSNMADLYVDINPGTGWVNGVHSYTNPAGIQSAEADPWTDTIIDLSPYAGSTNLQVRFRSVTNGCCAGDNAVDDVSFRDAPTCPEPIGVGNTNVTSTSADINWSPGTTGNTNFEVVYGQGLTFGNINTGTKVVVTGTTYSLTGLMPASSYCAFVREICAAGDTSLWAGPTCFNTLCPPVITAPYSTDFENISTGQQAQWENCWSSPSPSGPNWQAQTATGANQGSLNTGPFYDATTPGVAGGTYIYLETSTSSGQHDLESPYIDISGLANPELEYYYHMYGASMGSLEVYAEDQQGNRTFLDSLVGQQMTAGSDPFVARTVSLGSLSATTIRIVFVGIRGGSFDSDMAVDEVSVYDLGGCPLPSNLASSSQGCDSITVTWTSATGGSILAYGPQGFMPPAGTATGIVTSPYTITGLQPATAYDIYVVDTCTGDTSVPVGPITVSTSNITVSAAFNTTFGTAGASSRTAFFDASSSTGADNYIWDFGDGNTGTGQNTSNIYTVNGSYVVTLTVSSACGIDSITDTIVIEGIGLAESILNRSLEIFPNPAKTEVSVSFSRENAKARIALLDLSGKELMVRDINNSGDFYSGRIDISDLADGVYMLQISDGEIIVNRRLIKR